MNDYRCLLIFCRLGFGLLLLAMSVFCAVSAWGNGRDIDRIGAAIACLATFCCGIYFCDSSLSGDLWKPLWERPRIWEEDMIGKLPKYPDDETGVQQ